LFSFPYEYDSKDFDNHPMMDENQQKRRREVGCGEISRDAQNVVGEEGVHINNIKVISDLRCKVTNGYFLKIPSVLQRRKPASSEVNIETAVVHPDVDVRCTDEVFILTRDHGSISIRL